MAKIMMEKSATSFQANATVPPSKMQGLKKLCNTEWVHNTLARNPLDADPVSAAEEEHMVDLDYGIAESDVI